MEWQRKEPQRCMSRGQGRWGKTGTSQWRQKPCLPLYPEYSSRLTTLKMHTTVNPNTKLFSPAAKAQEFWIKLEACGKTRGIKKYQHSHGINWFDAWKGAREPQPSWLSQSYLCGHGIACYCPWWSSTQCHTMQPQQCNKNGEMELRYASPPC